MICAYEQIYLERARTNLGRMLNFGVHELGRELSGFFGMFIDSGMASRFERGDVRLIAGMSGVELAYEVLDKSGEIAERLPRPYPVGRSVEYWSGWALAYYQWATSLSFREIERFAPITDVAAMYDPYHEMDIRQFVDAMNDRYRAARPETNLKTIRTNAGLSQRELAELSSIPVRTIQQYEQRQKSINSAKAESLLALSRVLCCEMEDLIEKVI